MLFVFSATATTFYVDVNSTNPTPPYADWSTASSDIQSAIDAATNADLILVNDGVYATGGRAVYGSSTNRVAINKAVTVQSVNGPSVTSIRGYQIPSGSTAYTNNERCVYMTNNAVLVGFTVTGGAALANFGGGTMAYALTQLAGGGVFCESTNAILTNCILTGNLCASTLSGAGGGAICQGTLNRCILSNNIVLRYGVQGGAAFLSVLNNCLIISNSANMGGGAASSTLNHCLVIGNAAPDYGSTSWGGGTFYCNVNYSLIAGNFSATAGGGDCWGTLNYCVLSNNLAGAFIGMGGKGGGSYQQPPNGSYIPMLNNCLVISNVAGTGGGIYFMANGSMPMATNCTIVGNTATNQAGGVYSGILKNCIVYGNYCTSVPYANSSNVYSAALTNCWTNDPIFLSPANGDFHLAFNSPCMNSGNNTYVSGTNDLDGNPRIVGGTVDIGCYEYQTPASIISYAWLLQYGLPTDGSVDYADLDGTAFNVYQDWIAGLNPTNPASVLALQAPQATNTTGLTVTWQSVNTRNYFLLRSTNLSALPAFTSIQSNLVGHAGTTSFTDTTATNSGPYFYRVGVQ